MDGMRKCLEEEFSSIYVLNLRGNQRTSGELSRKEGGKIFGSGSRTPVTITFLVKNSTKKAGEKATIYYHDIGDYLDREKKLQLVKEFGSVNKIKWDVIKPNDKYDWINQRGEEFDQLLSIADKKDKTQNKHVFFNDVYTMGLVTSRDIWCFNSSKKVLENNIKNSIDFYNTVVDEYQNAIEKDKDLDVVDFLEKNNKLDKTKFSWDRVQKERDVKNANKYTFSKESVYLCSYRPFFKQMCYFNRNLNNCVYQLPKLFPTSESENLVICLSGTSKGFTCLVSNSIVDLHFDGDSQCFPLYYYEEIKGQGDIFSADVEGKQCEKKSGITDWVLQEIKSRYKTNNINKEQIFYYVYGILHSKDYREKFDAELKKSLPKLPIVDSFDDFKAFEKAGRELANLHLNYENQQPLKDVQVTMTSTPYNDDYDFYKVEKLKFPKKTEKNRIIYNGHIVIDNIPDKVYEYVVNGKSAVEWIMDRYQVRIDKDSLIKNDPNDWSLEHGKPRYILDLLLSVMTVSVKTIDIVDNLPKLKF